MAVEWWNPFSWFEGPISAVVDWLGGLGGDIASGIEGGFIAVLKDLWRVILPFLLILAGVLIAMFVISVWFASSDAGKSLITAAAVMPK